jgi:hypothetical protein
MQKYPRYAQLNDVEIVNAETSASLIPNDALFISYLIGTGAYQNYVLVFTLDYTGKLSKGVRTNQSLLSTTIA